MKTSKKVVRFLVLLFGLIFVIYWLQNSPEEFYPALQTQCLEPGIYDKSLSGKLVVIPQDPKGYSVLSGIFSTENMLYDLRSGETNLVDSQGAVRNIAVSPKGKWLAYIREGSEGDLENQVLVIRSHRGKEKTLELNDQEDLAYWSSDQRLALSKKDSGNIPETIFVDPVSMHTRIATVNFNDVISNDSYRVWENIWPVVEFYSPDLTRVLYLKTPSQTGEHPITDSEFFVDLGLSDTRNQTQLTTIESFFKLDFFQWRQDNKGLFLSLNKYVEERDEGSAEIWFLDRNGVVIWSLSLSDFFSTPMVGNLSLSPNSKYLAFTIESWSRAVLYNLRWVILDTEKGSIFDFCLKSHYSAIWSPDSRYVALAASDNIHAGAHYKTVIVDLDKQQIYEIKDGYIPVGWLK